jgi:pyruvate dehydrogenase E2 component (dihydrolipoamide acetyltransferase)
MAVEIKLEKLNSSMEEAMIVKISVSVGDTVNAGDVIAEIEADKATIEIESPAAGIVKAIIAQNEQTVPVGSTIMVLGDKNEKITAEYIESLKPAPIKTQQTDKKASADTSLKDLPARTADLSQAKLGQTILLSRIQKITGNKMVQSKQEIPCYYLTTQADVTELVETRKTENAKNKTKISFNDYILKAITTGLEKFPIMSGRLEGNEIILADTINIGLAVAAGDDLYVPVIPDAGKKSVSQIAQSSADLIGKVNAGTIGAQELQGACCTLTNLGGFGIDSFIPIVVPGQCFILGVGKINDELAGSPDNIKTVKTMSLTISVDHRIANGAYGAQFLDFVKKLLENPESLV